MSEQMRKVLYLGLVFGGMIVIMVGTFVLAESLEWVTWIGIALIFAGLVFAPEGKGFAGLLHRGEHLINRGDEGD